MTNRIIVEHRHYHGCRSDLAAVLEDDLIMTLAKRTKAKKKKQSHVAEGHLETQSNNTDNNRSFPVPRRLTM